MLELDEAQNAKTAGHELKWMAKLETGLVEPDEIGGMQLMPVGGNSCSDAKRAKGFMPGEARYEDEESDEWTTDTDPVDDVEIVREVQEKWSSKIDE